MGCVPVDDRAAVARSLEREDERVETPDFANLHRTERAGQIYPPLEPSTLDEFYFHNLLYLPYNYKCQYKIK